MKTYERILKAIADTPWAIHPSKMEEIVGVIEARMNGVDLSAEQWKSLRERREETLGIRQGVAILGLHGTISHKVGLLEGSGGTSCEGFGKALDAAMHDPDVASIVVDIDSPGGSVYGITELAATIRGYRGKKPMASVANATAFSAAYWLGASFDSLAITPSGQVGSIGVFTTHIDMSKMNEEMGVKVTYIHAGEYKVEGNPDEPLSDEARQHIQASVDRYYAMFVGDVAKGRGVTVKQVADTYGKGRTIMAKEALAAGMVDRIATLDQVVGEQVTAIAKRRRQNTAKAKLLRTDIDAMLMRP